MVGGSGVALAVFQRVRSVTRITFVRRNFAVRITASVNLNNIIGTTTIEIVRSNTVIGVRSIPIFGS